MVAAEVDLIVRDSMEQRAEALFNASQREVHIRCDRLFAWLLVLQWFIALGVAMWLSPYEWAGVIKQAHVHLLVAGWLGLAIVSLPLLLVWLRPGTGLTRHIVGAAQMLMGALLIHLTGGRIETHFHVSRPGEGSTFHFTAVFGRAVPASIPVPKAAPAISPSTRLKSLEVLLVEDGALNRKLAIRLLEKKGHRVTIACNGKEALTALERQSFDVVLMDLQMPEMGGLEATNIVRQMEKGTGRHVPIVAMTARALRGDEERCLQAGMDGYVSKPVEPARLWEVIDSVLGQEA